MMNAHDHLKTIHFSGELLPKTAQLLDLAARFCPVSKETRAWFSRFTNSSGVDDGVTVVLNCETLRDALKSYKIEVIQKLEKVPQDEQAPKIFAGWIYALDTILQQAASRKTCLWIVEDTEEEWKSGYGDGEISLWRV